MDRYGNGYINRSEYGMQSGSDLYSIRGHASLSSSYSSYNANGFPSLSSQRISVPTQRSYLTTQGVPNNRYRLASTSLSSLHATHFTVFAPEIKSIAISSAKQDADMAAMTDAIHSGSNAAILNAFQGKGDNDMLFREDKDRDYSACFQRYMIQDFERSVNTVLKPSRELMQQYSWLYEDSFKDYYSYQYKQYYNDKYSEEYLQKYPGYYASYQYDEYSKVNEYITKNNLTPSQRAEVVEIIQYNRSIGIFITFDYQKHCETHYLTQSFNVHPSALPQPSAPPRECYPTDPYASTLSFVLPQPYAPIEPYVPPIEPSAPPRECYPTDPYASTLSFALPQPYAPIEPYVPPIEPSVPPIEPSAPPIEPSAPPIEPSAPPKDIDLYNGFASLPVKVGSSSENSTTRFVPHSNVMPKNEKHNIIFVQSVTGGEVSKKETNTCNDNLYSLQHVSSKPIVESHKYVISTIPSSNSRSMLLTKRLLCVELNKTKSSELSSYDEGLLNLAKRFGMSFEGLREMMSEWQMQYWGKDLNWMIKERLFNNAQEFCDVKDLDDMRQLILEKKMIGDLCIELSRLYKKVDNEVTSSSAFKYCNMNTRYNKLVFKRVYEGYCINAESKVVCSIEAKDVIMHFGQQCIEQYESQILEVISLLYKSFNEMFNKKYVDLSCDLSMKIAVVMSPSMYLPLPIIDSMIKEKTQNCVSMEDTNQDQLTTIEEELSRDETLQKSYQNRFEALNDNISGYRHKILEIQSAMRVAQENNSSDQHFFLDSLQKLKQLRMMLEPLEKQKKDFEEDMHQLQSKIDENISLKKSLTSMQKPKNTVGGSVSTSSASCYSDMVRGMQEVSESNINHTKSFLSCVVGDESLDDYPKVQHEIQVDVLPKLNTLFSKTSSAKPQTVILVDQRSNSYCHEEGERVNTMRCVDTVSMTVDPSLVVEPTIDHSRNNMPSSMIRSTAKESANALWDAEKVASDCVALSYIWEDLLQDRLLKNTESLDKLKCCTNSKIVKVDFTITLAPDVVERG